MFTQYLHHIHPPSPLSYLLLPPTGTNLFLPIWFCLVSVFWFFSGQTYIIT
jgi:hypothetical protein